MKKLLHGCTRTEVWGAPKNWETTTSKASLKKSWYVQCDFYDPGYRKKYPKGFPYRKKLNKFSTLDERKAAIKFMIDQMEDVLDKKLYNPITKRFMVPDEKPKPGSLTPKLNFIEALRINYVTQTVSPGVTKEIRRIVNNLEVVATELKIAFPISEMHSGHVRDLLDSMNLTPGEYNKYLTHLSIVLSDLVEKRMLFHNPISDIKRKKTVKKIRETFEITEIEQIFKYLQINHYEFYRYGMIFFHSGSRTSEMFRIQSKDTYLKKQEFKLTIQKGSHHKEVMRPILHNVITFWVELLEKCKSPNDYLFAQSLQPGPVSIQPYQITKRFKRLVKEKLVFKNGELKKKSDLEDGDKNYTEITADFYSLKHKFLDELDRLSNSNTELPKAMAGHTTNITEISYLIGRETRKNEVLKKMKVDFINA